MYIQLSYKSFHSSQICNMSSLHPTVEMYHPFDLIPHANHSMNFTELQCGKSATSTVELQHAQTADHLSIDSNRYLFAAVCYAIWLSLWYIKLDLGMVFGYKGNDMVLKLLRKSVMGCWWVQGPLVWWSLTYPNQWVDFLTLFATIVFGGGWYGRVRHLRALWGLHHEAWGPLLSLIFDSCHHDGVALCILFESDANKRLYRVIFVWGWAAHTLGQITHHFGKYLDETALPSRLIWEIYWKLGPYFYGFWYITKFMESDEQYLSPSVIVFWFGRWMWSWNWPKEHLWRSESYNTILFLLFAQIFVR